MISLVVNQENSPISIVTLKILKQLLKSMWRIYIIFLLNMLGSKNAASLVLVQDVDGARSELVTSPLVVPGDTSTI